MLSNLETLVAREFSLDPELVYLNHAAVAPWPRRTSEAVCRFADQNLRRGAADYPDWLRTEAALRGQLRDLLGAPSADDIALLKNTSEGLSVVAHGLEWRPGDNVVISDQEFPSNRIVWESLTRCGVQVREVSLDGDDGPEAALLTACDGDTRLLAISSVQYATGLRMDLERLGGSCRQRGILFCVDAIQSLGVVPLDVQAIEADFVVADGHKWMLGPEGLAVFYCRAEHRPRLTLRQYGWHMVQAHGDYDRKDWTPADSARRFECGSPNMLGIYALSASLSLLLDLKIDAISRIIIKNTSYLIDKLSDIREIELVTPRPEKRRAGILSFRLGSGDQTPLHRHLAANGVVCALRGNAVRFSPHFYTTEATLDAAIALVRDYPRNGS